MRVAIILVLVLAIIGLGGFASASWLSHEWKEFKQNIKVDWHFKYQHTGSKKSQTFDSARCGTYYWKVQDRKRCWEEWEEKGVYIKGW
ncbi:MAG TPA: hypothetical protein HA222_04820 [Candidatus Diapherotrites archaeon]|uniref:Uncharacterized protein n=1 Tax=Candidatus Iainarchaeum sp. TaxID=3101447 RepID=A0A7J4JYB7_9ARCH|nr:hypothetical protein [Candidatus Diapherotrites archaeon]